MNSLVLRAMALAFFLAPFPRVEAQTSGGTAAQTATQELTAEQWREDLRFMVAEMKQRHANLYHKVSREQFESAVAELDARIPRLQRNEIIVGMMRLAAMIGDGHTRVEPRKDKAFGFRSLPVRMYLFDDGLFVRSAAPAHSRLLGARVEAIGGVSTPEAVRRVSELASHENSIGPKLYAPIYLGMPDILQALGLSARRDAAELTLSKNGKRWVEQVPVGDVAAVWPPDTDASFINPEGWLDARGSAPQPLWLEAPLDYHRLIELRGEKAIYAQLNWVTDLDQETLAQYADRIHELAAKTNPRAVILDVRLNTGGNGDLRRRLVNRLIKVEDEDTRLFVLTARGSFSATQFILSDLDRLSNAIFIGEPASSSPSGYGDAYRSVMPNSGITVRSSIKYWQDGQDFRPWTPVDIAAPLTFVAYAAGRDPALEAALGYKPQPPISEQAVAAAKAGRDVVSLAASWIGNPVNRFADVEQAMIDSTLALLKADQGASALSLARWSSARFPNSSDIASVHAAVAEAQGLLDEARRAGEAAVRADRNNRFARSLLERVAAANPKR